MIRYVLHALRAHWRAGRALFVLTVIGVALGVASVLSIQILNAGALAAFRGGLQAIGGDADLAVLPRGPSLPDAVVPEVLSVPGVRAAWPVDQVPVTIAGEELSFLDVIGVDLFAPRELPYSGEGEVAAATSGDSYRGSPDTRHSRRTGSEGQRVLPEHVRAINHRHVLRLDRAEHPGWVEGRD